MADHHHPAAITKISLINTGDEGFQNASSILQELRGRAVTQETIQNAIARIGGIVSRFHPARRQLHFVQVQRRTEPISEAAKNDDGKPFLGDTAERLNEPAWVKRSRERNERDAKLAAEQQPSVSAQAASVRDAQQRAESITSGTHAETDQLRKLFVTVGTEIDWVQTLAERQRMQKQFQRHRETSRFIR